MGISSNLLFKYPWDVINLCTYKHTKGVFKRIVSNGQRISLRIFQNPRDIINKNPLEGYHIEKKIAFHFIYISLS
jgi:hypothetical protein